MSLSTTIKLNWEEDMVCAKNGKWFNRAYHRDFLHLEVQKETHFLNVLAKVY